MRFMPFISIAVFVAAAAGGYAYWRADEAARVPTGLARANGRIEVERVDVAAKFAGRIAELTVDEGAPVEKGAVLVRLDTSEVVAQLAAAKAAVHRAHQSVAQAQANVALREADLKLAEVELQRTAQLVANKTSPQADLDRATAQRDVAKAARDAAVAAVEDAKTAVEAAAAQVDQTEAIMADMTLKASVSGRVEYRLAQAGEVVAAGGRVLTLLDLSDAHMTIFLPTAQVGRVALGSEARIMLDAAPRTVIPATVAFVAADAQFTPKYVETADEREKLMYRVKLHFDPKVLQAYPAYIKAGMTGNAYVKLDPNAAWPSDLSTRLPDVH